LSKTPLQKLPRCGTFTDRVVVQGQARLFNIPETLTPEFNNIWSTSIIATLSRVAYITSYETIFCFEQIELAAKLQVDF